MAKIKPKTLEKALAVVGLELRCGYGLGRAHVWWGRGLGSGPRGLERALRVGGRVQPCISKCGGSGPGHAVGLLGPKWTGQTLAVLPLILLSLRVPPCYPIDFYSSSPPLFSRAPRT